MRSSSRFSSKRSKARAFVATLIGWAAITHAHAGASRLLSDTVVVRRPYEFRTPGYSLRYILPAGRYRAVGGDDCRAFYRANNFLRREEVYRETAFSSELVRGGLLLANHGS